MFDFFRNLGKSAAEKRQELANAYLDGELSPREASRFEAELDQDPSLRAELAQLRQIKRSLQQLPQVRAPRNYTLDPAVYGVVAPEPASQWLPALRVATALTAFFFIITVALDVFTVSERAPLLSAGAQEAQEAEVADVVVEEVEVEGEAVAVTRVVTEMAEEPVEEEVEMAEDAAQLAPGPTEEAAASALAVEESAEAEEVPEAVEEEAAAEEAPEELEEEAAEEVTAEEAVADVADEDEAARATAAPPGAGGGPTSLPTPPADEASARQAEVVATPSADETATALFFEQGEGGAEVAQAPEEAPVEVAVESTGLTLSRLRVAQIVLGLLLAGLLVAWALARR